MTHRALSPEAIQQLRSQGCYAQDWSRVLTTSDCDLSRIRNVVFRSSVSVGANAGVANVDGVEVPCGLYNCVLMDCTIGENVRIAHIGSLIANYDIGDGAVIQNVAALTADAGSQFGAGTEVEVVNEAGGRVVVLIPELTAQIAYLQAIRLHDPAMQKRLREAVVQTAERCRKDRGAVGQRAAITHSGVIRNVLVGPHAHVQGVLRLDNGTILSAAEHPTVVGEGVNAKNFIIAEGASVTGGAMLEKVFVGQGAKIGKQFSAENALFFANCEGFHGEAVSLFAGPYTVTHHKSTLLIAGLFSFYNAGSGTNQSNHMYKLGPVHQGVFERGCKTGSFSYVLHETHVGAFSVIIGKHYTNIDTGDLPFSYIHETDGQSEIVPGMNLISVGSIRDGEKWPKRDNRKTTIKRDLITFDVFSPYVVEKMRRGRSMLQRLQENTPKEKSSVQIGGVVIKRLLLRKCAKYYSQAIERYLRGKVFDRIEAALATAKSWEHVRASLKAEKGLKEPEKWTDLAGLLTPVERLTSLEKSVGNGSLRSYEEMTNAFAAIGASYQKDEWEYVTQAFTQEYGFAPSAMTLDQARDCLKAFAEASASLHGAVFEDSKKEYDAFARIGYGLDMSEEEGKRDFETVRGTADTNSVVKKLASEREAMTQRQKKLEALLGKF